MILASDIDLANVLATFSSLGLQAAFLVPTKTAMEKSIIDATYPARQYLLNTGVHNYETQQQGQDYKVILPSYFVEFDNLRKTKTSLYRPPTKKGDPRIWFYNLNSYAAAYNLLAFITHNEVLYVINCSDTEIMRSLEEGTNPLFIALEISNDGVTPEANELLGLLCNIGQKGWIPTMRAGDTGVGFTLESLLGISANSSKTPDYKGVEIKSSRKRSSNQTLFGKTPDWKQSRLKSSLEILMERGRHSEKKNRTQLFHSIYAHQSNSYDLQLDVNFEEGLLKQYCNVSGHRVDDVLWELTVLQAALRTKHKQTFWVKTKTRKNNNVEEFLYHQGVYTRGPNVDAFPLLIDAGEVFVDYTIKQNPNGSAKDQGYLFRMKKAKLEMLFGKPKVFELI